MPIVPSSFRRILLALCGSALFLASARAAEPANGDLLPREAPFVIELREPRRLLDHPLVRRLAAELTGSANWRRQLASPEADRVRHAALLLEAGTGLDWPAALERLTAGGVAVAVHPGPPPRAAVVVTAADAEIVARSIGVFRELVRERLGAEADAAFSPTVHRGVTCHRAGDLHVSSVGRRLLLAGDADGLRAMVDRLSDAGPAPVAAPPLPTGNEPVIRLVVNLRTVRDDANVREALAVPASEAGPLALFGGWVDLLRRSDRLVAELAPSGEALELILRASAGGAGVTPGLEGFFAAQPGDGPAPLLDLPDVIYSASWFRDYAALWDARAQLLTEEALAALEEGDDEIRQQLSVLNVHVTPSALFRGLGPQFRVVLARQRDASDRVPIGERLPAAAVAVALRDENAFREQAVPLFRVLGLLAAFGGSGLTSRTTTDRDADLTVFRYPDGDDDASSGNVLRFNVSPAWTITRGHLILGSTAEIVRQVIDEIDRQSEAAAGPARGATEAQLVSFAALSAALQDFREGLFRGTVLERGLVAADAEREIDVLVRLLESLGRGTVQAGFREDSFEYRIRIEPR